MDHPGFTTTRQRRDGIVEAVFRGGVKPSHFKGAAAQLWHNSRWIPAKVRTIKTVRNHRHMLATLGPVKERIPPQTLGMWNLPEARLQKAIFSARVCDDLAGVAAILATLEALIAAKARTHVIGLCSRGEEVGFAGVLAVCENGWIPKSSPVIGLETSKAFPTSPQGAGPIIRVGDRTGIFSPGLTHFITQAAGRIADDDSTFKYQRKLMDGGTCNSTAFAAYGYDSAGICLALGNYHNMTIKGDVGYKSPGTSTAGPGIASETIHIDDFSSMARLLTQVATHINTYQPGWATIQRRLSAMHKNEQKTLLYA
jgi:putative aminopeptidase FrvX